MFYKLRLYLQKMLHNIYVFVKRELAVSIIICSVCAFAIWMGVSLYDNGTINDAELTYIGSIIGGGMTLMGVFLTIMHTNIIRDKDKIEREKEKREEGENSIK